ncbi:MAG: LysM peptidoglycan-binding domain-containing protein [Planctomycetota bacterium]
MHQDQRIGLALGVLLLGAAGAFFFRHEAKPGAESPRLRTAKQLDARIAEKSISPYLQGIEEVDPPKGTAARSVSDRGGPPLSQSDDRSLPSLDSPDFFTDDSREPFDASTHKSRARLRQEQADDGIPDLAPIPIPDTDEIATGRVPSHNEVAPGAGPAERLHVVLKGETLSSIAAKELGSTNRFIEIYEANRDQLKDANDVRVGMKLRMPSRQVTHGSKSNPTKSRSDLLSDSAPPLLEQKNTKRDVSELPPITVQPEADPARNSTPAPASPGNKKFVPVKHPPLGTRVPGPQTDASDPKDQAGRRLSQLPPENTDGKVAR